MINSDAELSAGDQMWKIAWCTTPVGEKIRTLALRGSNVIFLTKT